MKQLTTVQQQPIGELMNMAKAFAESGMFADTKSAAQAIVKIQAGQEIGIPPFAAMTGIHIIQGRPTIGAGLIASRIKGSGKYNYRVIEQGDTACSIDFYEGKEKIGNSTFTAEQAKKAGTKNMDKYPANMLFARAISNGVKWYCPDIFAGPVYTPEEIEDVDYEDEDAGAGKRNADLKVFEGDKPLITNKALIQACDRLRAGELETKEHEQLYDKLLNAYTFEASQRERLDEAWQIGCKVADKNKETSDLPFNA